MFNDNLKSLHYVTIALIIWGIYLTLSDSDPKGVRRYVWIIIWAIGVIQILVPDLMFK